MSTQRGTARRPQVFSNRRPTTWAQRCDDVLLTAAASTVLIDLSHAGIVASFEDGGTCMRLILQIHASNVAVVPDNTTLAFGVLVMTTEALGAGSTPLPLTDPSQDWFYWWCGHVAVGDHGIKLVDVDIRSARKLRAGYRLVLVLQNAASEIATQVSVMSRTLWKMG